MTTTDSPTTAVPRPGIRDRLRRERYLLALVLWLDDDYPSAQRRALVAQLRGELGAAAADTSMREAIRDLGPARQLAAEYSGLLEAGRPRWGRGAAAVSAWLLLCLAVAAIFASALWQVAADVGEGVTARLLWAELTVVNTPREASVAFTSGFPWTLLVALVVFVVAARAWRAVPALRRRGRTDEEEAPASGATG